MTFEIVFVLLSLLGMVAALVSHHSGGGDGADLLLG